MRMPGRGDPGVELGVFVDHIPLTHGNPLEVLGQRVRSGQAGIGAADHHGVARSMPPEAPSPVRSPLESYALEACLSLTDTEHCPPRPARLDRQKLTGWTRPDLDPLPGLFSRCHIAEGTAGGSCVWTSNLATVRAHERRSAWICNVAVVITFGIILLIVGLVIHSLILGVIGIILLVVGAILALLGAVGRAVFGRRHYW